LAFPDEEMDASVVAEGPMGMGSWVVGLFVLFVVGFIIVMLGAQRPADGSKTGRTNTATVL